MHLKHNLKYFLILLFTIFLSFLSFDVFAQTESNINFDISCSHVNIRSRDKISVYISASSEESLNLPSCKIHLCFDSDKLNFKQISRKNGVKPSNIKIDRSNNNIDITYAPNRYGNIQLNESLTDLFEIRFEVKSDLGSGDVTVACKIDLIESNECIDLEKIALNIQSSLAEDICQLKSLVPSAGQLSPDFNPKIYEYSLDVDCDEKWLDVEALPINDDLTIKINRRKLCAAGKSVNINVTVSSQKPRAKMIYTIQVNRAETPEVVKNRREKSVKNSKNTLSLERKNAKEKKNKSKKRSKNGNIFALNEDESDEEIMIDNEKSEVSGESKSIAIKNNNFKIYLYSILGLAILVVVGYYIFIKIKKRHEENIEENLNDDGNK